jgi:mRNA-degrading endonuclease RelE of RelBE toxin-antitoxin system
LKKQYEILIDESPRKTLKKLQDKNEKAAKTISDHIIKLEDDPYTPRSGTDIDHITDSNPPRYRLRIGDQTRVEYTINSAYAKVTITRIQITKRRNTDYKV